MNDPTKAPDDFKALVPGAVDDAEAWAATLLPWAKEIAAKDGEDYDALDPAIQEHYLGRALEASK